MTTKEFWRGDPTKCETCVYGAMKGGCYDCRNYWTSGNSDIDDKYKKHPVIERLEKENEELREEIENCDCNIVGKHL